MLNRLPVHLPVRRWCTLAHVKRPLAALLVGVLLFQVSVPAFAAKGAPASAPSAATSAAPRLPALPPGLPAGVADTLQDAAGKGQMYAQAGGGGGMEGGEPIGSPSGNTFTVNAFQTDLYSGAATAAIPLAVAPGTAGVAPKITLSYNSSTVDDLGLWEQAPWTGLGWALDVGGSVLRIPSPGGTGSDTFRLVFGGGAHDLVLIDGTQNLYHTKDETFWRVQRDPSADTWTLTTKDGTQHHFGFTTDSRAIQRQSDLTTAQTYQYLLSEVLTPGGTSVRYQYWKQTATIASTGQSYDQAVYPDTIAYTYANGTLVGPARQVRFLRAARTDYDDTSSTTRMGFFQSQRLDRIEMWVGSDLVRQYVLSYDYSIVREPGYVWPGGATGSLTLKAVTQQDAAGASLPGLSVAFDYGGGSYLTSVSNGLGGTVSFTYEHGFFSSVPLYQGTMLSNDCTGHETGVLAGDPSALPCPNNSRTIGRLLQSSHPGMSPLYSTQQWHPSGWCDWGAALSADPATQCGAPGTGTFLGYLWNAQVPGTLPLYAGAGYWCGGTPYPRDTAAWQACLEYSAGTKVTAFTTWGVLQSLLGYVYTEYFDPHRVTQRQVTDGRGGVTATGYSYGGYAVSSDGTRGHEWTQTVDPAGHYAITYFHQEDALRGRIALVNTWSSSNALQAKVINTWQAQTPYTGITFAALTRTDTYAYDGGSTPKQAAVTYQYDSYGNITQTHYLGDVEVSGDERTELAEYFPNTAAYIVGLPAHLYTADQNGTTVAQTWLSYDGNASFTTPPTVGRVTGKCAWLSGGTNPCAQSAYDGYGNVISTTDALGRTTTTAYDTPFFTFPGTVTSPGTPNVPGGLVATATYDPKFGAVLTRTGANGVTTTTTYDTFGRPTATTTRDQSQTVVQSATTQYLNFGSPTSQKIVRAVPDGAGGTLWTEQYFDGLGRVYLTRQNAPGGIVRVDTTFDGRGLVAGKTLPYFEGGSAQSVSMAYDALGRLTTTTYPDTTTETAAYSQWTITTTDRNGHSRTAVKDAYSRTVQVDEPGGAHTTYGYDALRLRSVTDANGNVTSMTYDTLGRKTAMTEPNLGTWAYAYDTAGNLVAQTDAKQQTVTFTYDALNRVASKTYPGAVVLPLARASKTTFDGYTTIYRGSLCVADSAGQCIGGDVRTWPIGALAGYLKATAGSGLVPAYQATCYSDASGTCLGWGLALDAGGTVAGYLSSTPPGSGSTLLTQSGGLAYLGTGLTGTAAYLWTAPPAIQQTDHYYTTTGTPPADYVSETSPGYLRRDAWLGTAALVRYVNGAGAHYYSTASDPPSGYSVEATLGQLDGSPGDGLVALYRYANTATGDYLLETTATTPSGYDGQTLLGYLHQTPLPAGTLTYTYDTGTNGKGRRSGLTDFSGTDAVTYDALGRPLSTTRVVDGVTYPTQTTYTAFGAIATQTYADGEVVTYGYTTGAVTSVTSPAATYVSNITYDAAGHATQLTLGNGAVTTNTYDPVTQRLQHRVTTSGGGTVQDLSYTYDNAGNILSLTDAVTAANSQTFTYDALDRLATATAGTGYGTEVYQYDAIGNLTSKAGVTYTYTGTACGRAMPHAVKSTSDGKSYTYDCNGNLVADGDRTLNWDADNKPASIVRGGTTTTFAYTGDGGRVKKQTGTTVIRYAGGLADHVTDGAQVKTITAGGLPVATRVVGGINPGIYYRHGDHLGSLQALTNASGQVVQRLTYKPYGETQSNTGSVDFEKHRFTGQEEDPETGLYYYHARYYNPALGRFISPDSIVPDPGNPQALNRYSYVGNNPVNRIDPSGHSWLSSFFKAVAKIIIPVVQVVASIIAVATGNPEFVPLIATMGSAAQTAVSGGNATQILASAGIAAVASGVALGVGDVMTAGLNEVVSPALDWVISPISTSVAAAAGGFVQGVGQAKVMGASWQTALRSGYQTAVVAAGTAAIAGAANEYYRRTVGFNPNPLPGETLNPGEVNEGVYNPLHGVPEGGAVAGFNEPLVYMGNPSADFFSNFWKQGGFGGKLGNLLFTGNAIAGLHDAWWLNPGETFNLFTNLGTMVPALVVTEAALISNPSTAVEVIKYTRGDQRNR